MPKDVQQSDQTDTTKPKVLSKAPTNQLDVAMKAAIEAEVKAELEQTVRQRLAESEKSEVEADINELNELIERARVDFEAKKAELAKNDKETERDEAGNAETDKQFATEESQLDEQMDKLAKERDDYVQDKAENESKLGELKAMRVELADLKLTTRYLYVHIFTVIIVTVVNCQTTHLAMSLISESYSIQSSRGNNCRVTHLAPIRTRDCFRPRFE